MKIIFIKEAEDTCDFVKRFILKIKSFFNIINIDNSQGKTIYYLPIFAGKNITTYRANKLSKKIIKNLEKDGANNVVVSKYLDTIQELKNNLYRENINILNGRYLFKCLTFEVIEYVLKRKKKDIKLSNISILVNDFNDINTELIIQIAKNFKTLNIITNHINKCKNIENYLYDEFGIIINVSNNKKTSLLKSEIILNLDFSTELINQYKIYDKAIIVNIFDKILIKSKKFNGININYFKINLPKKYKLEGFQNEVVYESLIYQYNLYKARELITKDKIKILKLIGNNGYIKDRELQ